MIFVGIGSNLAAPGYSSPQNTAEAALAALPGNGAVLCARSSWYASEPVPASDQPWFINAVVEIGTEDQLGLPAAEVPAQQQPFTVDLKFQAWSFAHFGCLLP